MINSFSTCFQQVFDYEDNTLQSLRDDSDTDDDGSSFHDDGESSDEEPPRPQNSSELEWDHSNLSFWEQARAERKA